MPPAPREVAERLMMQVHTEGRAVVASGNREAMDAFQRVIAGMEDSVTIEGREIHILRGEFCL